MHWSKNPKHRDRIRAILSGVAKRRVGSAGSNWKGGVITTHHGYIAVMDKSHPHCDSNGYVLQHRVVMEKILGRILLRYEIVHHLNGVKDDNRPQNLVVMTASDHAKHHSEGFNNPFFGKKHRPESKSMIAEKAKGRPVSDSTRQLLRGAHLGKKRSGDWLESLRISLCKARSARHQ